MYVSRFTYPFIKAQREHGKTISLALSAMFLLSLICFLQSSFTLESERAMHAETQRRLETFEEQLKQIQQEQVANSTTIILPKKIVKTDEEITREHYPKYVPETDEEVAEDAEYLEHSKIIDADESTPPSTICPGGKINPAIFSDGEEWVKSPYWKVPSPAEEPLSWDGYFTGSKVYFDTYRKNPPKMHIPRLNITISQKAFVECFMNPGFPVILNFDRLRPLGFKTKYYTSIPEIMQDYPTTSASLRKKPKYKANGLVKGTPDIGPGLEALLTDAKKKKNGIYRNYPRNMKLTRKAVNELGIDFPPYHNPRNRFQLTTMFMGATTADTPMHCDCCDNFCSHILGTKRWVIAPPTEGIYLKSKCFGGLCWAKSTLPNHPSLPKTSFPLEERRVLEEATYHTVDVHAGEILFLPAGWYHAVYNLSPTLTTINWVSSGPSQLYVNVTGLTGGRGPNKNKPCLPGMTKC